MSVLDILMKRDGLSQEEAEKLVDETREMMEGCNYDPFNCELIVSEQLGLETDYIFEIIDF